MTNKDKIIMALIECIVVNDVDSDHVDAAFLYFCENKGDFSAMRNLFESYFLEIIEAKKNESGEEDE